VSGGGDVEEGAVGVGGFEFGWKGGEVGGM